MAEPIEGAPGWTIMHDEGCLVAKRSGPFASNGYWPGFASEVVTSDDEGGIMVVLGDKCEPLIPDAVLNALGYVRKEPGR